MNTVSAWPVIAFVAIVFLSSRAVAQDCADPQLLCGQSAPETLSTADGINTPVPASFCFDIAENAVFFDFQTLDLSQFPGLSFDDPTATLSIGNISCLQDSTFGEGILYAVFAATNACDESTFDAPIACDTLFQATDIPLDDLDPSTTYTVMISGFQGDLPAINPGECEVSISVSGPAVTYDFEADWYPDGDQSRNILLSGETVVLTTNPDLTGYSWTGEALNETSGPVVTAIPVGVDQNFEYIVETTINGCIYSETLSVLVRPAILPYNAFTPNADGINDTWEIKDIEKWQNAQINVYSRWGTRVFQATNYKNDWGGDDLPAATYYYVIELNPVDFNSDPYTGSVTILR
ncbi:gliding motility-associated C-terminal domain-containing protein [Cryomorpha ignava]|uniref:Gliding motility-associated C-terminal domain-containing protein n=1 Tax=Cryomorpha ignava TaxID=101383 RepID=A0A7K3WKF4_9FLAO|nr:gliding motility-associated C-terminal domain-containing protein [Cryomorpha ignava]NEN21974.1 gliding motility-associated C-terminal domain-containing protein [Cryomorpha ignava]